MFVMSVVISGCWDRREINDVAFVSADAIDMENDKYRMSVQIPLPGQLGQSGQRGGGGGTGGEKPWYNDSQTGESGGDILDRQQLKLSRQINFSHRRIILFGEQISRAGLSRMLDILARVPQNRLTAQVLATEGPARDVLNTDADLEKYPSEMIRELASASMKKPRSLKDMVDQLLTEGIDPSLPFVVLDRTLPGAAAKPKKIVKIDGIAVFRDDKLAGFLRGEQAVGAAIAMNDARNPIIVVPAKSGLGQLSLRIQNYDVKLKPSAEDGRLAMNIDIKIMGSMQENGSDVDETPLQNLDQVQRAAAEKIKNMVESAVTELQTVHLSDPIGFGDAFHRKNPKLWHQIAADWRQKYRDVRAVVSCSVHIEQTGSLLKPFGVQEVRK